MPNLCIAYDGTVDKIKQFIEEKVIGINDRDYEGYDTPGQTMLHKAAFAGNIDVVKYLVSKGATINIKDDKGWTPLHLASVNSGKSIDNAGKLEVVKFLVANGAEVNAENNLGYTPYNKAIDRENAHGGSIYEIKQYLESVGGRIGSGSKGKTSGGGCYIATAVYESYDAPEVMCLRRFRDETLSATVFGRLLIKLYYKFSPLIAEKLKETKRINMLIRKILDKFVGRLNKKYINL